MTNDEINKAVAEARGWTNIHTNHDGILVGTQPGSIHEFWVPDEVNDPAAWGVFYSELMAGGYGPGLNAQFDGKMCEAILSIPDGAIFEASDPLPGRALALAFLKSKSIKL